ncbi:acyl carrier protein [Frankia sp. CNm7]|uniref:Acyl carrier protein n=1 Tax=Frankia nepalensis TaxID=1836974 RepID=A0A937UV00_9ACTN|nr:acyl carrier protein [Frankia nepalensis]MBL7497826.1 acyl carrier protein [Frankia nepalensis]MBL7512644.1 acyl carrier protein [Frankia nepalensis]MBL7522025.1 acyl carrier protein [Frankia nepalensis]MBL7631726.1 acyl carrier protein [Frankia nepalensis]
MQERLRRVFREIFADDALTLADDTTAADIPAWDSLAHINLMFAIENEFGVEIPDERLGSFANVGELRRYLEEHLPVS